ncbi:L-type lectin-domain containing receptor kinase IV.1-like [Iris pallida]|uniref:non-specific serine/threonine protein kinase n=1 Tax=Iris pallida TaxID=29817 RepID=A0AAX6DYP7_IRIPA|nr:L-type lectin-domain containing receptor kinase IV.1-like [Iris pallida]
MPHPLLLLFLIFLKIVAAASTGDDFTFNGFGGANFSLDGAAEIDQNGLLRLTTPTRQTKGHAFYPTPFYFKSPGGDAIVSFSTTFAFAIVPEEADYSGNGILFVVSHTTNFTATLPNQYLGIFSQNTSSNTSDHVLAVELDTIYNPEIQDIDNNHVGIDVNSIRSIASRTAGYYDGNGSSSSFKNLTLRSGQAMQVWVEFNGTGMRLDVTLAPIGKPKPARPLLSSVIDSKVVLDPMYVGFSSATGSFLTSHYILGWSFKLNGTAAALDYTKLPPVPRARPAKGRGVSKLAIALPFALSSIVLLAIAAVVFVVKRRRKYAELLEDWEQEYGPHRFSYKDLFRATGGFKDKDLLGIGGFGRVYRGVLPASKLEVAVKRVSHDSKQGMKEFVAEIVSIGQLRHRNIVQLLGYCRRKGELLLVYDYMPNGSLDKLLHDPGRAVLSWALRFRIVRGVAAGLLYLHEDWEQVVLHRDIKASNVLLDGEMNGRLGDFGLARLYDHGTDPQTTHVVGTMGYLAPELARTGKATTKTDVFAYGAFLLEVACGRRPLEPEGGVEELVLVDWVVENWKRGSVLKTSDPRLRDDFPVDEMEMVLKLGLLCCHPIPAARPSMRQVVRFLEGEAALPELSPAYMNFSILSYVQNEGFDDYIRSFPSSSLGSMSTFSGS